MTKYQICAERYNSNFPKMKRHDGWIDGWMDRWMSGWIDGEYIIPTNCHGGVALWVPHMPGFDLEEECMEQKKRYLGCINFFLICPS